MRRVTLAARRAQQFLRRPPQPRWIRPARVGGGVLLGLGLLGGLLAWASATGMLKAAEAALTGRVLAWSATFGLEVREVYVEGRERTDKRALRQALGVVRGEPILAVDPETVRARLLELPWVADARVIRYLPDRVHVRLFERRPLALWQRGGVYALLDRTGTVIEGPGLDLGDAARYRHLRVLVGEAAPAHANELFALLSSEPELWARVVAATWVGDRRWTLRLDNQIDVLLPEDGVLAAWRLLAEREREQRLLQRTISVVDLRFLPDRLRLRVDPIGAGGRGA
jgi:cell division protein FtsQ